jgi:photosystem II stability/assembly factor-like uncharacterized protein
MKQIPVLALALILLLTAGSLFAQSISPADYSNLQWRMIGPYRGGRTVGAAGVPQQPNVFYIGVNNGGLWKTTDFGHTWFSVFDKESTGSIGCITVAPSNPDIIYVGSGEGLHRPDLSTGNGLHKSMDAGKSWTHLGLEDGQQIPKIAVDPKNPDRLFVAVLGHPYGPNTERGIYRSTDGGKTFEKVLYRDENTGGDDVEIDPANPNIVYATLWESREGPWENASWAGTGGGVYKSTDGGNTWDKLTKGFPSNLVQAHIAIAASNTNIVYAAIATTERNQYGTGTGMGIFRSGDAGENWKKVSEDGRPEARIGGGDLPELGVDAKNPDRVYSTSIVLWRSEDGGKTWTGIRGAPGGDDYQNIWINPDHPDILLVTGDQGAIVSVNGGATWSSWYNQPTAQLYHVSADNAFPYNVYSGQQESGSVGIASRGNDGKITFREWHPVGAEEYGYVAPDPLDPDIIYGGKITRYNKRTGQVQHIAPEAVRSGKYRYVRTAPVLFSPIDPKTLFFAGNVLFKTRDGGSHWQVISPDLTRSAWDIPASVGIYTNAAMKSMPRRGVIYTVAPSYKNINTIWCGTDDGLVQVTRDGGKTWKDVTPAGITAWSKFAMIDAGRFDANTAYAAVNRLRCDDQHPYIYRTHDGGKTWQAIINGLPDDPINTVREDPKRKGLLFAGSERAVYVSFDDGGQWQPLRLNMPASSVRDLIVKDDDIVAATHGRSFWILDDITPLRQLAAPAGTRLYTPQTALRVRWSMNTDTPLPPEEPGGQNPPDGAIIDYYLDKDANGEVSLEITDERGNLVRRYSSNDTFYSIPPVNIPLYWIRPQQLLSAKAGPHRFLWDMHYTPIPEPPSYPIAAVYQNTAPRIFSPWVMPGHYTVRLTVNGKQYTQPLAVKMDPRVKTTAAALLQQFSLSMDCYNGTKQASSVLNQAGAIQNQVKALLPKAGGQALAALNRFDRQLDSLTGSKLNPGRLEAIFGTLFNDLQDTDMPPLPVTVDAVTRGLTDLKQVQANWMAIKVKDLPGVNAVLQKEGMAISDFSHLR